MPCHIWLPCSMLVPIDIWVLAQSKTAITEWCILIHHLGSVKRAAVCGAGNQRTWGFKERMTFKQPCLFLERVGVGNVAIQISWKVQGIFTLAISFLFFIPFLHFHSHLCDAFYNWNCHLFKKKPKLKWWPQTIAVCTDIGCIKAAPSASPGHRRPSVNVQSDLHVTGLAGWVLCADQKPARPSDKWRGGSLCVTVKAHSSRWKLPAQELL